MVNKYYQKHKEKLQKEAHEWYQNLLEEEKEKGEKKLKTDIKIFLKRKKKKIVSIIMNVIRFFLMNLSEEEKEKKLSIPEIIT